MTRFLLLLTLPLWLLACTPQQSADPDPFDVLIINGTVLDGGLSPGRSANIGITGDRIASMNTAADAPAAVTIDAAGYVVVPGFIDPHTHATEDLIDELRNANVNYLTQGVTTVFVGNDGRGLEKRPQQIATMKSRGIGTNVAFFAGHGTIRSMVMGLENRAPSDDELEQMRELVAEEMRAGAIGLSTGLYYTPGSFSDTAEIIELARVAARFGGVYDSHLRDESSYTIGLLGAVGELIDIAEAAGIPAHIAHLKALGRDVWGQSGDVIGRVEAARERGLRITADQYPWRASGTSFGSALMPRWVMADSQDAMYGRLDNPELRDRILEEMRQNLWRRGGAASLLVTDKDSDWRGMTLQKIAERLQTEPLDAAIEVIRGGDPSIASFNMKPTDIQAIAIQPWVMTGSDGSSGHPRKYASYPKAYQDMVRDQSLFPLERFVHRSSGLVADFFSLCDRGYLREGLKADIAVIDLDKFLPYANFEHPTELSSGVSYLLVNGELALKKGERTDTLSGVVIDRQDLNCED